MKKFNMGLFFLFFFMALGNWPLFSKGSEWSAPYGNMNWRKGKAKCKSIGMRLPSVRELEAAYASDPEDSWGRRFSNDYWSSTAVEGSTRYHYTVNLNNGLVRNLFSGTARVRCHR